MSFNSRLLPLIVILEITSLILESGLTAGTVSVRRMFFINLRRLNKMNILHLIPSVGPMSFGPGYVALDLAKEQQQLGCFTQIWCLDTSMDIHWASEISGLPRKNIRSFSCTGPRFLGYSPEMERFAAGFSGKQFNVIHQHGIWTGISRVTYKLSKKYNIPSVIAPHGSLESWALKKSNWKKQIARYLYESRNLTNAACIHATAEPEVADFQNFGLSNPVAVIPNGISNKWLNSDGRADNFRNHFKIDTHKRILLSKIFILSFLFQISCFGVFSFILPSPANNFVAIYLIAVHFFLKARKVGNV
jgi:glycosyltransferase involved in cell wall biosynthesis